MFKLISLFQKNINNGTFFMSTPTLIEGKASEILRKQYLKNPQKTYLRLVLDKVKLKTLNLASFTNPRNLAKFIAEDAAVVEISPHGDVSFTLSNKEKEQLIELISISITKPDNKIIRKS